MGEAGHGCEIVKTITFDDGYTVTIDRHLVRVMHEGKEGFAHVTHWEPVTADSAPAAFLEQQGKDIADYLFAAPTSKWQVVRAGNGVREAIHEALEDFRVQEAESNRVHTLFQRTGHQNDWGELPIPVQGFSAYGCRP